jgi:choline-sulfatase
MLRQGHYKYIYYVGMPPQLFNLKDDPEELNDIAGRPEQSVRLDQFRKTLTGICDPEAIDQRAKADQAALVARHGGREKIVEKGGFGATPAPGHHAKYEGGLQA